MNARKSVVATAYGGVTDYLSHETGCPVDYRLIKVGEGHLPYPEQFIWADPLTSSLRSAMRRVYKDRNRARTLALRGHARVRHMFSLDRTAAAIRSEIMRIWDARGL
jgi:hypothetical protein